MSAISRHITIEQGATWSQTFACVDSSGAAIDLTGYTVAMQIRSEPHGALLVEPTVTVTSAVGGLIVASLTATETGNLYFDGAVYDIEATSGSTVLRLYAGSVRLSPEVTLD